VYLQAEEEKKHRKFHKHQSKSQVNFETESQGSKNKVSSGD
jgi:hypothetical protein